MICKDQRNTWVWVLSLLVCGFLLTNLASCGKSGNASKTGLNIQYEILNLSPDLGPVDLYIDFNRVNTLGNPFIFNVNHGYFYIPSTDIPYQVRYYLGSGAPIAALQRTDTLKSGAKYSYFITGKVADNSLTPIFLVDTATAPPLGKGLLRFVNASPSATGGLDVYANGTLAFNGIVYKKHSAYIQLPVGNYDLQIDAKGSTTILSEQQTVTIQDGRLYTLYAAGYTTRTDSAAFTSAVIVNK